MLDEMTYLIKRVINSDYDKELLIIKEFEVFLKNNFDTTQLKVDLINKIDIIRKKYRNKAAHTDFINLEKADNLKTLVRETINEFNNLKISYL
jgi:hypothetical protein